MSAQTRVTQIEGVSTKPTAKGDLFVILAGGTEYSTFQGALANQAHQLRGKNVNLRFTEKTVSKDGRSYTNRYYEGAEEAGFGAAPTADFTFTSGGTSGSNIGQLAFPQAPPADTGREDRIMRQTATKVAAALMPYLPEDERTPAGLLSMSEFLLGYYKDGIQSNGDGASYGDPGPSAPPFTSDDDIPF